MIIPVASECSSAPAAKATARAAGPDPSRGAPAPSSASRKFHDRGRVLCLRVQARSALGLGIRNGQRAEHQCRGGQSHGDFSHEILLAVMEQLESARPTQRQRGFVASPQPPLATTATRPRRMVKTRLEANATIAQRLDYPGIPEPQMNRAFRFIRRNGRFASTGPGRWTLGSGATHSRRPDRLSSLFDRITELPEYYPTLAESAPIHPIPDNGPRPARSANHKPAMRRRPRRIRLTRNNKRTMFPFCSSRGERHMVRAVAEEALALASITLFLAMVAVWAQVLGVV